MKKLIKKVTWTNNDGTKSNTYHGFGWGYDPETKLAIRNKNYATYKVGCLWVLAVPFILVASKLF